MKKFNTLFAAVLLSGLFLISGCGDDDAPPPENEEEVIDLVRLTFTPAAGGEPVVFTATDPDGLGPKNFETSKIVLAVNTIYTLNIEVENTEEGEDITEEIEEEGDEHQFFFGWTGTLFSSPTGLGNIGEGNEASTVNYTDQDENGLPIGLQTTWQTSEAGTSGTFLVLLKHQPDTKSETSTYKDGESDINLTWNIEVQ